MADPNSVTMDMVSDMISDALQSDAPSKVLRHERIADELGEGGERRDSEAISESQSGGGPPLVYDDELHALFSRLPAARNKEGLGRVYLDLKIMTHDVL